MSGDRPVSSVRSLVGTTAVYVHDDRLEIGKIDVFGNERLQRVYFRDAVRLLTWPASRTAERIVGILAGVAGLLAVAIAFASGSDGARAGFLALGLPAVLIAALLIWRGRPGGLTNLRLEGRKGAVEAQLAGWRRKRETLVRDLAERIHARQADD